MIKQKIKITKKYLSGLKIKCLLSLFLTHIKWYFSLQFFDEMLIIIDVLGGCITTSDSLGDKNASCIIPFKYKGILKNGCITEDDPDGRYWCSTRVDDNLMHVSGEGNWGYCRSSCPEEATPTTIATTSTLAEKSNKNYSLVDLAGQSANLPASEDYEKSSAGITNKNFLPNDIDGDLGDRNLTGDLVNTFPSSIEKTSTTPKGNYSIKRK